MSARDLARIVQAGLQELPPEEQRAFFALVSPLRFHEKEVKDEGASVNWPDQEARLREILGDKILSFNPVLEERETSRW